jgi:hypothetical protein
VTRAAAGSGSVPNGGNTWGMVPSSIVSVCVTGVVVVVVVIVVKSDKARVSNVCMASVAAVSVSIVRRELLVPAASEFNSADSDAASSLLVLSVSRLLANTVVESEIIEAVAALFMEAVANALSSSTAVGSGRCSLVIFNVVQITRLGVMQLIIQQSTHQKYNPQNKQVFYCSVVGMQ